MSRPWSWPSWLSSSRVNSLDVQDGEGVLGLKDLVARDVALDDLVEQVAVVER